MLRVYSAQTLRPVTRGQDSGYSRQDFSLGKDGGSLPEMGEPRGVGTVAVVITTYNDAAFLREAVESVLAQRRAVDEIVVVDDGSEESPEALLRGLPRVRLLRQRNGGVSQARNVGLEATSASYVCFLDADDRLAAGAIEAGLRCFAEHPEAGMVYGAHRRIGRDGEILSQYPVRPAGGDAYAELLRSNCIGMLATVLYRRRELQAVGGFDEGLRRCEDYDLYLRMARRYPVAWHGELAAEYRWHGGNTSGDTGAMLRAALEVHGRHGEQPPARRAAWHEGQRVWRAWYNAGQAAEWRLPGAKEGFAVRVRGRIWALGRRVKRKLAGGRAHRLLARVLRRWPPPVGAVRWGRLDTTAPISMDYGWDRGTPIDRYYIERFLEEHRNDIRGRVLEVGDDGYSRRFGGARVTGQDVLHWNQTGGGITITGDLTVPGVLPEGAFDCIVFTETLQFVFDLQSAVAQLHGALKPGGVLLLTAPGIRQVERTAWGERWFWSFTRVSIERLFVGCFAADRMQIRSHGNVFAAMASLHGAAVEEVDRRKLDVVDPVYQVVLTLRAQKGLS